MKRPFLWAIGFLLAATLGWLLPPFHVVSLRQARQAQQQGKFDAPSFARQFWDEKLLPAASNAVPVGELLAALAQDPAAARQRFCRSPGLSATTYAFVKGSGRIVSIEKDAIRLALDGAVAGTQIELATGLLFGNAVRDASGLLNVSDFPNSQEFNDLSTELNRLVETQVVPALREHAAAGQMLRFTGCIELEESDTPKVLSVIPLKLEWL